MLLECETDKMICSCDVHLHCYSTNRTQQINAFLWKVLAYPGMMDQIGQKQVLTLYWFTDCMYFCAYKLCG